MTFDSAAVLSWFSGKARENASAALELLRASIDQGYWVPKASRKIEAALSKANVAEKYARKNQSRLRHEIFIGLAYGFRYFPKKFDADMFMAGAATDAEKADVAFAREFHTALAPVYYAMDQLDATRPPPVFTSLGVSRTVTRTLETMALVPTTLRVPPIEHIRHARMNAKTGLVEIVYLVRVLWPAGTVHCTSKDAYGNVRHLHSECDACGHRIRNAFNWVPLVADGKDGAPRSLWVGRDCAENLFGIKATGELEYEGEHHAKG